MALAEDEEEWQRSRSAMVTSEMTSAFSRPESVRKKKQQAPRPYTPQHTNLSTNLSVKETEEGEDELDISRSDKCIIIFAMPKHIAFGMDEWMDDL